MGRRASNDKAGSDHPFEIQLAQIAVSCYFCFTCPIDWASRISFMNSRTLTLGERQTFAENYRRLLRAGGVTLQQIADEIHFPLEKLNGIIEGQIKRTQLDFFAKLTRITAAVVEEVSGITPFRRNFWDLTYRETLTEILTLDPSFDHRAFSVIGKVVEISDALIRHLARVPTSMHKMHPRLFEKLVAELLVDQGCEVELTPFQKDGGRDIIAFFNSPFGRLSMIVECKRYDRSNPVSVHLIREFLFTIRERDRVNLGLIATSSYVTRDALKLSATYDYLIKTRDFDGLTEWLRNYGRIKRDGNTSLWTPTIVP